MTDDECSVRAERAPTVGGPFEVAVLNRTDVDAGFDLYRLHADKTYADWVEYTAIANDDLSQGGGGQGDPISLSDPVDVMEAVPVGQDGDLVEDAAEPGIYAVQCWRFLGPTKANVFSAGPLAVVDMSVLPPARGYHALVDVPGPGVLLFGGFNTSPPLGGHLLSDFWRFESETGWTRLEAACDFALCEDGYPDVVATAAFDPGSGTIVLVNETGGGTFSYDPIAETFADLDAASPPAGVGASFAFDTESGVLITVGGLSFSPFAVTDATFAFDPGAGAWTGMNPADSPPVANYHRAAYDPVSDRVILFGGADRFDAALGDTWAYDFNSDTWTNLRPAVSPPGRYYSALVYDPGRQRMILFGGTNEPDAATFGDTWAYDPATDTWTDLDVPGPTVRGWHAMAYDDATGLLVLFGGGVTRESYVAETWLFDPRDDTWRLWSP